MTISRQIGWGAKENLLWQISKQFEAIVRLASKLTIPPPNPYTSQIIYWLNLLTDTTDTSYDGVTPSNDEISAIVDVINGEII